MYLRLFIYFEISFVLLQVVSYLTSTCSKEELISLFAVELTIASGSNVKLPSIFISKLVQEAYFDIASTIITEMVSSNVPGLSGEDELTPLFLQIIMHVQQLTLLPKTLEDFIQHLYQKENEPITYFAVLLAMKLRKWDNVVSAIKNKGLVLPERGMVIFLEALMCHSWHCAALALDSFIKAKSSDLLSTFVQSVCVLDDNCVPEFFTACRDLHLPEAGATMAIWHRKLKTARSFIFQPIISPASVKQVLTMLMARPLEKNPWILALDIIKAFHDPRAVQIVLKRAAELCSYFCCGDVLRQLLVAVEDEHTAQTILGHIVRNRQPDLLRLCFAKDLVKMARYKSLGYPSLLDHVLKTVEIVKRISDLGLDSEELDHEVDQLLRLCIEAGLTTETSAQTLLHSSSDSWSYDSSLSLLAKSRSFDVLALLRKTGAISNQDMFLLTTEPQLTISPEGKGLTADQAYLHHSARNVATLKNLSVWTVSQSIGCDADRKHRALQLPLPMALVQQVLLFDVLFDR